MILPGTGRGTASEAGGGGGVPKMHRPEVYTARKLRREMRLPEILVWQRIKGERTGLRFRKQHPIGPYVADFHCSRTRAVIEVDGKGHEHGDMLVRDDGRDAFMVENGYRILRVMAAEVLRDADGVVEGIVAFAALPLHHQPAAGGPPPRAGEEW